MERKSYHPSVDTDDYGEILKKLLKPAVARKRNQNYSFNMSGVSRAASLIWLTLFSQLLSHFTAPGAHASQNFTYTFTTAYEDFYQETSAFKPPMRLSKSAAAKLAAETCQGVVSKNPQVLVRSASGKLVSTSALKPNHRVITASWIKDDNGENVFRFQGSCIFVGSIPRKLPASNYYQFSADPMKKLNWQTWSYPYSISQLAGLKGGITETRVSGGSDDNRFSPVPIIEMPIISQLNCVPGSLDYFSDEPRESEAVEVAHFAIANPIYVANDGEVNWPQVWLSGERQPETDDYKVRYLMPSATEKKKIAQTFSTWKRAGESSYSVDLNVTIFSKTSPDKDDVAAEKTYAISIDSNCKSATITPR